MFGEPNPKMPMPPPAAATLLLSRADLARELCCSAKTISRMDATGKLPRAIRLGSAKRWRRDELVLWITAGAPSRREWEAMQSAAGGVRVAR